MGNWVGDLFEGVAGDAIEKLITFLAGWVIQILTEILNFVGTWWLKIGAPSMGEGSATERIQTSTVLFVGVAGVLGTAFALIKIARDQDRNSAENLVMGMVRTILTTAIAVPMVALLFAATDELAPWLVTTISGSAQEDGLGQAMGLDAIASGTMTMQLAGIILFIVPLALLGAILNALIVIFSYGMAIALCGVLPIFAAASQTERGRKSFDKAVAWLAAVVLFKPAAAILYGAGLALLKGIEGTADNELGNTMISLITGLVVILSASVAMPALAKVLVPAISAGPQGMGASGLAMLGGALALGAVTAGVGAAGMAAAGTAGGAGTAGTAAATEAAGTAGTAGTAGAASADGMSGTPALTGGTGSGGGPGGAVPGGGDGVSGGAASSGAASSGAASSGAAGADGGAGSGGGTGGSGSAGGSAGGPTGAEQQAQRSGAPGATETGADSNNSGGAGGGAGAESGGGAGGPTGAERQTASSGAPAQTEGGPGSGSGDGGPNGSGGGPAGAEPSAGSNSPSTGSAVPDGDAGGGPQGAGSESPAAQGYRDGAPGGAEKTADRSGFARQRVEFALRDAAREAEHGVESGNDV
ncbi:hypothetical protein [Arthrobacter cheniae]|uniref:hypothetical protein n=1 Tax=Arthrobacter cheniae TaxID=1258888 RepID=UPI0016019F5B|nr:hypothetical protein [Arthrobacter cheniae]